MANTFITNTSKFRPFSFQEMLQPYQIYTDAYNAYETELTNLDILGNDVVSKLSLDDPEDLKLLEKYKSFKSQMDETLDSFYKEGLTPNSKKALSTLKSQYSKDINPINTAYERRLKDMDLIRQHQLTNPNLIIEGIGNATSSYMNGATPKATVVDLNKASDAAKNASIGLSKQFIDQIGLKGVDGYIGQYLMHGVKKGITSDMVSEFTNYINAIKKDQTGELKTPQSIALYNMFEQIRTANNYDNLSQTAKDRLDASIIEGLVSGAASDININYMADNYWDIESQKENINYIKARIEKTRNSGSGTGTPSAQLGTDLRTTTVNYKGKDFDINNIANTIGTQFETPLNYNGTVLHNSIQAYNEIHKDDAKIVELEKILNNYKDKIRKHSSLEYSRHSPEYNSDGSIKELVFIDGKYNEDLTNTNSELTVLKNQKRKREDDLKDVVFTDKELNRFREYTSNRANEAVNTIKAQLEDPSVYITDSKGNLIPLEYADSSSIVYSNNEQDKELTKLIPFYNLIKKHTSSSNALITPEEVEVYATLAASDLEAGDVAEKKILVFDKANSKSGLPDALTTLSRNMNDVILNKGELDIVDANNKPVKLRKLKNLYKQGVLDPEKILGIELDFNSAATGRIRLNTTEGIFYLPGNYLGDQANNFINGVLGIKHEYNKQMSNYMISKAVKAANLNTSLRDAADAIQEQFSLNRDQEQSYTISNTDLNKIIQYLSEEE